MALGQQYLNVVMMLQGHELREFEDKHPNLITIDSDTFKSTTYIVGMDDLIVHAGKSGVISIKRSNLQEFISELQSLLDVLPAFTERNPDIKYKKGQKNTLKTVRAV